MFRETSSRSVTLSERNQHHDVCVAQPPRVVVFAISERSGPHMARYLKLSTIAASLCRALGNSPRVA
jgi:hypothetical protein